MNAHEAHFAGLYRTDHKRHRGAANKHVKASGADTAKCLLFLVAVPDVNVLRKAFYQAMGVEPPSDDIPAAPEDYEDDATEPSEELDDVLPAGSTDA